MIRGNEQNEEEDGCFINQTPIYVIRLFNYLIHCQYSEYKYCDDFTQFYLIKWVHKIKSFGSRDIFYVDVSLDPDDFLLHSHLTN